MRVGRCDNFFVFQIQCADKRVFKFRKEMKRSSQESNVSADWFSACQSADGLIDNRLEYRSRKVFLGSSVVDQGLDFANTPQRAAIGYIVS